MEKDELLKEIEKLLSFDGNPTTINPDYLAYFSIEELESIKKGLEEKYEKMVEENFEWLQQFKKES
ncbi:hypothetical protein [Hydrogenimonas sp.]|uniref:hypothetical protein n=1 Tax=Hydrogenimonas sp. TaxID=2231112 RepID=UPI00263785D8|nr:hypothetical protein [Hydrogenimonas sp.]